MDYEIIKKKLIESIDFLNRDFLIEIQNNDLTLDELLSLKKEINKFLEDNTEKKKNLQIERENVVAESRLTTEMLERLEVYEDDKDNVTVKLLKLTIKVDLLIMVCGVSRGIDLISSLQSLSVIVPTSLLIDLLAYNKAKLKIIKELETLGDLDELLMRQYNSHEKYKVIYDMMVELDDKARCAILYGREIDLLIEKESQKEENKEYVKTDRR